MEIIIFGLLAIIALLVMTILSKLDKCNTQNMHIKYLKTVINDLRKEVKKFDDNFDQRAKDVIRARGKEIETLNAKLLDAKKTIEGYKQRGMK